MKAKAGRKRDMSFAPEAKNTGAKSGLTMSGVSMFNKRLVSCAEVLGIDKPRTLIITSPAVRLNPQHIRKESSFCSLAGQAWEKMISVDDMRMNDGELETLQDQFFELEGPEDLTEAWVIENEEIFSASFARRAVDLLKSRLYSNREVMNSQVKLNATIRKARAGYLRSIRRKERNTRKLYDRFYRNAINDGESVNLQEFEFMMKEWCIKFESSQNLKATFDKISGNSERVTINQLRTFLGTNTTRKRMMRKISGNTTSGKRRLTEMRRMKKDELRLGVVDTERAMRSVIKYCSVKSRERGRYLFQQQLKKYQLASGVCVVPFPDEDEKEVVAIKQRIANARRKSSEVKSDAHPFDIHTIGGIEENSIVEKKKTSLGSIATIDHQHSPHRRKTPDTSYATSYESPLEDMPVNVNTVDGLDVKVSDTGHTRSHSRSNPYMFAVNGLDEANVSTTPSTPSPTKSDAVSTRAKGIQVANTSQAKDLISNIVSSCDLDDGS